MSEPANELELEQNYEPEPSKEASWFFKPTEVEEPKAEAPSAEKEPGTKEKEEAAPAPLPPPVPQQQAAPVAPPPEFMQYIAPVVQQTAQTNAALQQIAQLQMQAMQPPPPEMPKPDPIEQPEEFTRYMFEKQFEPIRQQQMQMAQQQLFMLADQQRQKVAAKHKDFELYAPAIYQQANMVPLHELTKEGTWEYIFRATRDFIKENMPDLVDQPQSASAPAKTPVAPPHAPAAREAAPHIPTGTMGGGEGQTKMTQKFIRECQRLGQKPEEVLAFAIKEGIKPEELMD